MRLQAHNVRQLCTAIGIGNFSATMVIPFLFMAPATTDPKSPAIILLVQHLQRQLNLLGAGIAETGYLDIPTAAALEQLMGNGWMNTTWSAVINAVVFARETQRSLAPVHETTMMISPSSAAMPQATGMFEFLPDLPGGALTYVAGAGLLYYLWTQRKH